MLKCTLFATAPEKDAQYFLKLLFLTTIDINTVLMDVSLTSLKKV